MANPGMGEVVYFDRGRARKEMEGIYPVRFKQEIEAISSWSDDQVENSYGMTKESLQKDLDDWRQSYVPSEEYACWCRFVEATDPEIKGALNTSAGYKKKPIPAKLRWAVFKRDGYCCRSCGSDEDLTADHMHPEARGGETILENLQTLCRTCNSRKGAL